MDSKCIKCGATFTRAKKVGRPATKCEACRAGKVTKRSRTVAKVAAVPPAIRKRNPEVDKAIAMLDLVRGALTAMA